MGKLNLSEAAKEILASSVTTKQAQRGQGGTKPEVGASTLPGDKQEIGHDPIKTTDSLPDYLKGVPTATAPGATPPVGSEPMKKLAKQPQEEGDVEEPEGKKGGQTFQKNPGAADITIPEEIETSDTVMAEEKDEDEGHEDEKEDKKMIKKMMAKEKMKEDIDALLQGENLSEEFASKAATIFEAAVVARSEEVIAAVEAELTEQFDAAVEQIKEELASKVDDYLNYMVEEWMKENEIAIEKGLRAEIVEDFIGGLRDLFAEHYIDIPSEKVDVVEELTNKVEELENSLNEQIARSVELTKELNEQKKIEAIYTACEGLTQTQVEKLKSLAEGVEFTTDEEFAGKLATLKESYFKADVKVADTAALDDEVQIDEGKKAVADPIMEAYVKTISQSLVK